MDKLENKVNDYIEVAKDDKNVDVAALMLNALQTEQQNTLAGSTKKWAYLISLGAPPLGLLFAAWFWFSDKDDARQAASICLLLTIVSGGLLLIMTKLVLTGSGTSIQQIQQIKPADIQQLAQ